VRALRWDGARLAVADVPEPLLEDGFALVRVRLAGVCATDLQITRGYLGFRGTLGHEFTGVVEAAADPQLVGARVCGEINFACANCPTCAAGLGRHCPNRRVMGIVGADGAFAERVAVPIVNLHRIPESVPDSAAVFVEPLAAAFEILEQVQGVAGSRAVVLGDGKLGLLIGQVLQGAGVVLAGRHDDRIARARALGLQSGPPEPGADLVVDATGSPGGLATALALVRPRGTVVLKTTVAAEHRLDLATAVVNEVPVVGSRFGPFRPAIDALSTGRVSVAPLIDAVYPLAEGVAALERASRPGTLKVLIETA
jgi:threonine dehydrogenase-like Zn-dependent dehydrogenase